MHSVLSKRIEKLVQSVEVLIIDDTSTCGKSSGIFSSISGQERHEAADGIAASRRSGCLRPTVMLDWEMPLLNGAELVRSCGRPGVSGAGRADHHAHRHVERWRVVEATRLGVNEFLAKPVSARPCSTACGDPGEPRPMVKLGDYYGRSAKAVLRAIQKMVPRLGKIML